jgi:hypothetical protein
MRMCEFLSESYKQDGSASKWQVEHPASEFISAQTGYRAITPTNENSLDVIELGSGCGACGVLGEIM